MLREFTYKADRETCSSRWSYHRDFGRVRLVVMDSRAGRMLEEEHRTMLDDEEWAWVEQKATGEFDHLLFGTSLPFLLGPGLHHLEAASEAICKPWFENHISTLEVRSREAVLKVEKPTPENTREPRLHTILEHRLA